MSAKLFADELFGYKIIAYLGEGARSKLYAVKDRDSGATYALKHVIFDESRGDKDDRFLKQVENEYNTLRHLSHSAIRKAIALKRERPLVQVTEVGLVLEMIDTATLEEEPPQSLREYVRTFAEVAEGLAHIHSKGFAHADMKTGNIMMPGAYGALATSKIIDLGQSCKIGTVKERTQGSPGYMAPEQAAKDPITERTDIYNFGATMYRALARDYAQTVLVPGTTKSRSPDSVPATVPLAERVAGLNGELSDLIMECLVLPIDRRPRSMDKIASRLRGLETTVANITI